MRVNFSLAAIVVASLLYVVHPWIIPTSVTGILLGLPGWLWIDLAIMLALYALAALYLKDRHTGEEGQAW